MYADSAGREYLVQLVPMERDRTLPENMQPKAVVFQTEEGWIRVSPVGHDFSPDDLSSEEIVTLIRHASGRPPEFDEDGGSVGG